MHIILFYWHHTWLIFRPYKNHDIFIFLNDSQTEIKYLEISQINFFS